MPVGLGNVPSDSARRPAPPSHPQGFPTPPRSIPSLSSSCSVQCVLTALNLRIFGWNSIFQWFRRIYRYRQKVQITFFFLLSSGFPVHVVPISSFSRRRLAFTNYLSTRFLHCGQVRASEFSRPHNHRIAFAIHPGQRLVCLTKTEVCERVLSTPDVCCAMKATVSKRSPKGSYRQVAWH